MNELFVLGELMEGPQNGYQLRNAMQWSLGKHRKISFGVIYPLLDRLAAAGYVAFQHESDGRHSRVVVITELGRERFRQLMETPILDGAHSDDLYLIKLDAMQHLPIAWQLNFLDTYAAAQQAVVSETEQGIKSLSAHNGKDHWYAGKKLSLRLQQAKVALQWAQAFRHILETEPYQGGNTK